MTRFRAVKGCSYVLHVASPVPIEQPKAADVLVKPALEGTLNVLKAAAAQPTVKRLVLCSSIAAVMGEEARVVWS